MHAGCRHYTAATARTRCAPSKLLFRCQASSRDVRFSVATAGSGAAASRVKAAQQQAVVIGSGMAGLAAAEMLAKHFARVIVLEKDKPKPEWEQSAVEMVHAKAARRGVTQYAHLHGMTARGLVSLDATFQGRYTPALEAAGGVLANLLTEGRSIHPVYGRFLVNYAAKPITVAFGTRHLFEQTARKLVASNDRVQFMYGATAAGLEFGGAAQAAEGGGSNTAVTGVRLADGSSIPAVLVVDASGRHSAAPDWLAAAGYQQPRVSYATANCGYASVLVRLAPEAEAALAAANIKVIYCMAQAPIKTLGIIIKTEGGTWMVGVGGYQGHHPPFQDDKILQWAEKEVWQPEFARLLSGYTPLTPVRRFYGLGSTWRHYEEAAAVGQLPEGLLLLADSICSFQPVYGQGMTVAALEVETLDKLLTHRLSGQQTIEFGQRSSGSSNNGTLTSSHAAGNSSEAVQLAGLAAEFQAAVLPIVRSSWDLAVGNDMQFAGAVSTDGPAAAGLGAKFQAAYMAALFDLATSDPVVNEAFMRVLHMLDPPEALSKPALLGRVALHWLTSPFSRARQSRHVGLASNGSGRSETGRSATAACGQFDLGLQPFCQVD